MKRPGASSKPAKEVLVMSNQAPTRSGFTRRTFVARASALAAASLLDVPLSAAAEPPPETKRIRLVHAQAICFAPQYVAEELLRMEGFSEVTYAEMTTGIPSDTIFAG